MSNARDEYRQIIEKFAREHIPQRVPNGLPQHAAILLETMFKYAGAEMRIFSGELHEGVFGQPSMIDAVVGFIEKRYSSLRILLEKEKDDDWVRNHPLVKAISQVGEAHGHAEIRCASGLYAGGKANHFAVMDNDGYRFERDHASCRAIANFNEPDVAKSLIQAFDVAFDLAGLQSKPIFLMPAA